MRDNGRQFHPSSFKTTISFLLQLLPSTMDGHKQTSATFLSSSSTRESSSGQAKLERPMEMPVQAAGSGAWLLQCISTLASCLLGFLLYFYAPWWGVRRVPGPPALPLVGHLPLLARHGPDVFALLADKYGPIFRFHLGRQSLVIVADPELCKEVGIRQFKSIPNRSSPSPIAGSALHQRGLFFTRDARWSAMRNTIVSLYQPSHLAGLIPTMQRCIERAAEAIPTAAGQEHGDGDFDFSDLALKLATDVIGQAAFGVDFALSAPPDDGGEAAEFIAEHVHSTTSLKMDLSASLSIVLGLVAPALQEPARRLLRRIPGTADWRIARTNERLRARLDEIVARRERHREERRGQRDFLSALLNARDGSDKMRELLTPEYVGALTYEHLLAGSATTSFTLSSAVYLVAVHPEVEAKLLAEVDQSGPRSAVPTADDLQHKFPYLDQVIMEAMRFYMVSPLIAREVSQRVEVGGYALPKGTWLWLAPGVLARDATQFPDPGEFRPERFEAGCEERRRRHPYAHIPFGLGPRACVGQRFSLQEVKLAMVHLYRRYVFRRSPRMESPPEFQFGMVLSFRHGVKLRAIERCNSD